MPKPWIVYWVDGNGSGAQGQHVQEAIDVETQAANRVVQSGVMPAGWTVLPMRWDGIRSRGARGDMDAGANPGFPVRSAQNPEGIFANGKAAPLVKVDEMVMNGLNPPGMPAGAITDAKAPRQVSIECNSTHTGYQPGTQFRFNYPVAWADIIRGYWDQPIIDKLADPWHQALVDAWDGVKPHHWEVLRSEINIHQGEGEAQPGSASSYEDLTPVSNRINSTKYQEFKTAVRYLINFYEGRAPGASGLVNPHPIPHGMYLWAATFGSKQFVQGGSSRKFIEDWIEGMDDILDVVGADGYNNANENGSYESLFDPCKVLANSYGFRFGVYETGQHGTAAQREAFYRPAWNYLATQNRTDFPVAVWTAQGDLRLDQPGGTNGSVFTEFVRGWQEYLAAPDPGGGDPDPDPCPDGSPPPCSEPNPDFVPGVVPPMTMVKKG